MEEGSWGGWNDVHVLASHTGEQWDVVQLFVRSKRLLRRSEASWLSILRRSRLPEKKSALSRREGKGACLELFHDRNDLIFESFVCHFSTP